MPIQVAYAESFLFFANFSQANFGVNIAITSTSQIYMLPVCREW